MARKILFVFFLLSCLKNFGQDLGIYEKQEFKKEEKVLPYRILYPWGFDSSKKYPVVIFLHGYFEKGNDNVSQLNIGGRFFLDKQNRIDYPAIVIFPQCPTDDSWAYFETKTDPATGLIVKWKVSFKSRPTPTGLLLKQFLDEFMAKKFTDSSRIYIGGLSEGGMGVYDMIARYPDLFAAAFPICGAGDLDIAKKFAGKVSLWIFHGEKDDIVPVYFSREFYKKLKKLQSDVTYTEYPGVRHNSWLNAFKEPELLSWLFSKEKKK